MSRPVRSLDWRIITVGYATATLLLVAPTYLLGVAVIALLFRPTTRLPRPGAIIALAAIAGLVLIGLLMCAIVLREHPFPGLSWPSRFERWHEPALFLLLTLTVGTAHDLDAERPPLGPATGDRYSAG